MWVVLLFVPKKQAICWKLHFDKPKFHFLTTLTYPKFREGWSTKLVTRAMWVLLHPSLQAFCSQGSFKLTLTKWRSCYIPYDLSTFSLFDAWLIESRKHNCQKCHFWNTKYWNHGGSSSHCCIQSVTISLAQKPITCTRWFKYDRDWFVCKQAALRSICATLRE